MSRAEARRRRGDIRFLSGRVVYPARQSPAERKAEQARLRRRRRRRRTAWLQALRATLEGPVPRKEGAARRRRRERRRGALLEQARKELEGGAVECDGVEAMDAEGGEGASDGDAGGAVGAEQARASVLQAPRGPLAGRVGGRRTPGVTGVAASFRDMSAREARRARRERPGRTREGWLPTAEATRARRSAPDRRAKLPGASGEWAVDVDDSKGADGAWARRWAAVAAWMAGTGGVSLFDTFSGLATALYAGVMAGWTFADMVSVDNDEHGDMVAEQRASLVAAMHDRFPDQVPARVLRDMGRMGDDVMKLTRAGVRRWVRETPSTRIAFLYTWPCRENTAAKQQRLPGDRRRVTDRMLRHVLRLRDAARDEAARVGKQFCSIGENTPTWLPRDGRFRRMRPEEQRARRRFLAWLKRRAGPCVVWDAALVSAAHRLRQYHVGGFWPKRPPRVRGRRWRDVLEPHQRPQKAGRREGGHFLRCNVPGKRRRKAPTVMRMQRTRSVTEGSRPARVWQGKGEGRSKVLPSLPGLAAMVGFYAPWLAGGVLTASPSLGTAEKAEPKMRRALGEVVDAQMLTWLLAEMARAWAEDAGAVAPEGDAAWQVVGAGGQGTHGGPRSGARPPLAKGGRRPPPGAGTRRRDPENYVFRHAARYAEGPWAPSWDIACLPDGTNCQPFCRSFLSVARPAQLHWRALIGRVFWGNLPFSQVEEIVPALLAAVGADPLGTRGTLMLPVRTTAPWYKRWVACRNPVLRHVYTWKEGTDGLFYRRGEAGKDAKRAGPTPEDVMIVRIGHTPEELADGSAGGMGAEEFRAAVARACASFGAEAPGAAPDPEEELGGAGGAADDGLEERLFHNCWDPPGTAGAEDDEEQAPGAEQVRWRRAARRRLDAWLSARDGAPDAAWRDAWEERRLASAAGEPHRWFGPRAGRTREGPARLRPRRWREWARRWERAGDDRAELAEEAAQLAEGDADVPHIYIPPRGVYRSAPSARDPEFTRRIKKEMGWYEHTGAVEFLPAGADPAEFVHVVNGVLIVMRYPDDGKGRMCLSFSASGVTSSIAARSFRQPVVTQFLRQARRGDWFMRTDIAKAFYNLRLRDRRMTGFVCPFTGRLGRFAVPVFGLRHAPECLFVIANTAAGAMRDRAADAAAFLRARGDEGDAEAAAELMRAADSLDPYADDFCAVGTPLGVSMLNLVMYEEAERLGLAFDPAKDVAGPEVVVLGALLSSERLDMQLAPKKRKAYAEHMAEFMEKYAEARACPREALERLRGRLGFVSLLSRWARVFIRSLDEALYPPGWKGDPPRVCRWGEEMAHDLELFWWRWIRAEKPAWFTRSQWSVLPIGEAVGHEHYVSVSDASGSIGAGGVSLWGDFLRRWGIRELPHHINVKELAAAVETLLAECARYRGTRVILDLDNTGAVSYVNRGTSGVPEAKPMLRLLAALSIELGIDVRARHRAGTFVMVSGADDNSRGKPRPGAVDLQPWWAWLRDARRGVPATRAQARAHLSAEALALVQTRGVGAPCTVEGDGPKRTRDGDGGGAALGAARAAVVKSVGACVVCARAVGKLRVRCTECDAVAHRECALWDPRAGAVAWTCPRCVGGAGREDQPWDLTRAAALLAVARAAGTYTTYATALRRFVDMVQRAAVRKGRTVTRERLLPPGPTDATEEEAVLAFLGECTHVYSTASVEGTLAALTRWHRAKSGGTLTGPAASFRVKEAMSALRRVHRGTQRGHQRPVVAMPAALVRLLHGAAEAMAADAGRRGALHEAYAHSRDALYYVLAFLACLRKSEAVRVTGADFSAGVRPGTAHLFIAYSKSDQNGVGVVLPIALCTSSGIDLGAALAAHQRRMKAVGADPQGHLFGVQNAPRRRLQSADSILRRMRRVHMPDLAARGFKMPDDLRFAGHSFRRGGINAVRDAARRAGREDAQLRTLLMRYGRWRDERSLLVYLADNWEELARLTERV